MQRSNKSRLQTSQVSTSVLEHLEQLGSHLDLPVHDIPNMNELAEPRDPDAFYCINCDRKLFDKLMGLTFYIKVKCARCKAKFVISKE